MPTTRARKGPYKKGRGSSSGERERQETSRDNSPSNQGISPVDQEIVRDLSSPEDISGEADLFVNIARKRRELKEVGGQIIGQFEVFRTVRDRLLASDTSLQIQLRAERQMSETFRMTIREV